MLTVHVLSSKHSSSTNDQSDNVCGMLEEFLLNVTPDQIRHLQVTGIVPTSVAKDRL